MSVNNLTARELAHNARNALDALLQAIEGGEGLRVLSDARGALTYYMQSGTLQPDKMLTTTTSSVGGVTLVRGGQHFTINDNELDIVREAINTRKRELRKRERLAAKASGNNR